MFLLIGASVFLLAKNISDLLFLLGVLLMVGILIGGILLSTKMEMKATSFLNPTQMKVWMERFKKQNQYLYSIINAVLGVLYVVGMVLDEKNGMVYTVVLIFSILAALVGTNLYNAGKFKNSGLPTQFTRKYFLAKTIETIAWSSMIIFSGYMAVVNF